MAEPSPALSRDRIVDAAVELADREGLEALTMRRLATGLGVGTMTLYGYVSGKDEILDAVAARFLGWMEVPEAPDWRDRIRGAARSFRQVGLAHPNLVPLAVLRPVGSLDALPPIEAILEVLRGRAALDPEAAVQAYRTLASFVGGFLLAEVAGTFAPSPRLQADALDQAALKSRFPRLIELAPLLLEGDRDSEFVFGVEIILAGLEPGGSLRPGSS